MLRTNLIKSRQTASGWVLRYDFEYRFMGITDILADDVGGGAVNIFFARHTAISSTLPMNWKLGVDSMNETEQKGQPCLSNDRGKPGEELFPPFRGPDGMNTAARYEGNNTDIRCISRRILIFDHMMGREQPWQTGNNLALCERKDKP